MRANNSQQNNSKYRNQENQNDQIQGRDLGSALAKMWKDETMIQVPPHNVLFNKKNKIQSDIDKLDDIQIQIYDNYQQQQFDKLERPQDIKNINQNLLENLINEDRCDYQTLLPVQKLSIPIILQNRDIKVQSNTGSGKTNAFLIPIIQKLLQNKYQPKSIKVLIISPTRELAQQICFNTYQLIYNTDLKAGILYGGDIGQLDKSLMFRNVKQSPDILISCPGKLLQLYRQKVLSLKDIQTVVIDEADKCFDMGFEKDIMSILNDTDIPQQHQTLMFSATFNNSIQQLCDKQLKQPVCLTIQQKQNCIYIKQEIEYVNYDSKYDKLKTIIQNQFEKQEEINQIIVFCNEKQQTQDLYDDLHNDQIHENIYQIHGDMEQKDRTNNINKFKKNNQSILICTDACQRGLDFPGIQLVINFNCPNNLDSYIHRIGRTGRVGRIGRAITFFSDGDNRKIQKNQQNNKQQFNKQQNNNHRKFNQQRKQHQKQNDDIIIEIENQDETHSS